MSINLKTETIIPFSEGGDWYAEHAGYKPNRSTTMRWRTRGSRGVKLESVRIGGRRFTSEEAIERFNAAVTAIADGYALSPANAESQAARDADAFLASEGI